MTICKPCTVRDPHPDSLNDTVMVDLYRYFSEDAFYAGWPSMRRLDHSEPNETPEAPRFDLTEFEQWLRAFGHPPLPVQSRKGGVLRIRTRRHTVHQGRLAEGTPPVQPEQSAGQPGPHPTRRTDTMSPVQQEQYPADSKNCHPTLTGLRPIPDPLPMIPTPGHH